MIAMTTDGWIILTISTTWLVLPAALAIFRGRRWRIWFFIGIFIPVLTILILLLLPTIDTNRSKSDQKETKRPKPKSKINKEEGEMKKSYTDNFKREVALAANEPESTLASVGQRFGVNPTLVRNWKQKFSDQIQPSSDNLENKQEYSKVELTSKEIAKWLQKSIPQGKIDSDGDLHIILETSATPLAEKSEKLFLNGVQRVQNGSMSENSPISGEITLNQTNWLRGDYISNVGKENKKFIYNLDCQVHRLIKKNITTITMKDGSLPNLPINFDNIQIEKMVLTKEEDDFRVDGTLKGPKGFVYAISISRDKPEEDYLPNFYIAPNEDTTVEIFDYLWDVSEGDQACIVLCSFERLPGIISCEFSVIADIEESDTYKSDDESEGYGQGDDFLESTAVDHVETSEGDIGIFEFEIKRGLVDESEIDDEELKSLVEELKGLCAENNYDQASELLIPNLSFEFDPSQLDDGPERFFANTDYIEFECTSENTSVKLGYGDCLVVTISVRFEIPLNAAISTVELAEYLPDSGAWASASASPGWGYSGSDGDNVYFLGVKGGDEATNRDAT